MLTGRATANLDWPVVERGQYLKEVPECIYNLYDKIMHARADSYIILRDPEEMTSVPSLISWAWLENHHWLHQGVDVER